MSPTMTKTAKPLQDRVVVLLIIVAVVVVVGIAAAAAALDEGDDMVDSILVNLRKRRMFLFL